jgi:DNA-binding NtrC family response regulator
MKKDKILIIEDNLVWREKYKKWLTKDYEYKDIAEAHTASPMFDQFLPNLVILDLGIPTIEQGFEVLDKIIAKGTDAQIIVITASKDHKDALEAQRRGAHAYFFKGENIKEELPLLVRRALKMQALERENKNLRKKLEDVFNFDDIIAVSKQMHNILALIEKISSSMESVLIMGESGVGKEVIARHIHRRSILNKGSFVAINCAAMPENLLENELFGHEKGAFTGALALKKGRLELAIDGTLFLDEIGDMPLTLQAKLLRVLQDKKFYRLGGNKEISVNLRLIAATNKNLSEEVKSGRFREDLFYRLNVIPIHIPPLRERPDDIPALIDHFAQKYCHDTNISVPRIESGLISFLSRLTWPGNIRQLENTLKRMLVLNHTTLSLADLPDDIKQSSNSLIHNAMIQQQTLEELSKTYVNLVLTHFKGNKKEACAFLNINYRTLQRKLEKS